MGPLDALWHLTNLFAMAWLTGAVAAAAAKLIWRRDLAAVRWLALAGHAIAAGCVVTLAGLLISGRDGRMATYGAMVVANAITLWWRGFGPGRSESGAR